MEAEARGQLQILKAKADGMKLMVESCGGSKDAFQLLMLDHMDKLAETAATAISNIKFDKVVVWDGGNSKDGGTATSNFLRGLATALPPTMQIMKDIAGVEMPEFFGTLLAEDGPKELWEQYVQLQQNEKSARDAGNTSQAEHYAEQRKQIGDKLRAELDNKSKTAKPAEIVTK